MNVQSYLYNYHDILETEMLVKRAEYERTKKSLEEIEVVFNDIIKDINPEYREHEPRVNPIEGTLELNVWDDNIRKILKKKSTGCLLSDDKEDRPSYFVIQGKEFRLIDTSSVTDAYTLCCSYKQKKYEHCENE